MKPLMRGESKTLSKGGVRRVRGQIFQIDNLYLKGKVQGSILSIKKDAEGYEGSNKFHDLEKQIYPLNVYYLMGVSIRFTNFTTLRQMRLQLWRGEINAPCLF